MFGLTKFQINEYHEIHLGGAREFENLDVSEVARALRRMAEAVDRYADILSGSPRDE